MMKPRRPQYISTDTWDTMNWKEKDYIQLLSEKARKKDIMRTLYITTEVGYWKFRKRVIAKINAGNRKHLQ